MAKIDIAAVEQYILEAIDTTEFMLEKIKWVSQFDEEEFSLLKAYVDDGYLH